VCPQDEPPVDLTTGSGLAAFTYVKMKPLFWRLPYNKLFDLSSEIPSQSQEKQYIKPQTRPVIHPSFFC